MKLFGETVAFSLNSTKIPPAFHPLVDLPLIIMVGLTGVGKSTIINLLQQALETTLLPNRRVLTDDIIIASLQNQAGEEPAVVADRLKRFEYTARYRAQHPGGMAHALSQLWVKPVGENEVLIFDGLRGLNEVSYASRCFPQARFIVLEAPDLVRLSRLLQRGDTFDVIQSQAVVLDQNLVAALSAIPEIELVFTPAQLAQVARAVSAAYTPNEVAKKVSIIVEERRNYDPEATRDYLVQNLPSPRVLVVDTTIAPPEGVADQIKRWL